MRFINWNQDVADSVLKSFSGKKGTYSSSNIYWCNVAEALVEDYYCKPIHMLEEHADDGIDMELNGMLVDIKAIVTDVIWFDKGSTCWSINYNTFAKSKANTYLFVGIDKNNEKLALIGCLSDFEVAKKGQIIKQGEPIPQYGGKLADVDTIVINIKDLYPIF